MNCKDSPLISYVVPVHNEESCVRLLYERIEATAKSLGVRFELIFVDDGSTDSTLELIKQLQECDPRVRGISLSRNFGHQVALTAGLQYASGDCVAVLDGDLQDPPDVISRFYEKWREGYHVVYGIRQSRQEHFFLRKSYELYYWLLSKCSNIPLPRNAGDFSLLDRRVVEELTKISEYRPYVRGLRTWVGFTQTGVMYDRPARVAGKSKYAFVSLIRLGLDGLISFSDMMLNSAIVIGLVVSIVSLTYGSYIALHRVFGMLGIIESNTIEGWTSIACAVTVLIGLEFIYLGILGKYVGRIFMQTKGRPLFIVRETVGVHEQPGRDKCHNPSVQR